MSAASTTATPLAAPALVSPAAPRRVVWAAWIVAACALATPVLVVVHGSGWLSHATLEAAAIAAAVACVAGLLFFLRPSLVDYERIVAALAGERRRRDAARLDGSAGAALPTGGPGAHASELEALLAHHTRFAQVAALVSSAVVVADREARIVWVNRAFERLTGYTSDEALGRRPSELLVGPGTSPESRARFREAVANRTACRAEVLGYGKDGRTFWIELDLHPTRDARGEPDGFIALYTDLTERQRIVDSLQREAMLRRRAESAARVGAWWSDARTGEITWSPEIYSIFGLVPQERATPALELIAFGPAVVEHVHALAADAARTGRPFETEVPLVDDGSGERRWVRLFGVPQRADGAYTGMSGAVQDITHVKRLEADLAAATARERRRIAAELHDDLGQVMTGLRLSLDVVAARSAELSPSLRPEIDRAQRWVMRAQQACRALAHNLNALVLHEGLASALHALARELPNELCSVHVDVAAVHALGAECAQDVHRIAQEAVANALRHGLASHVVVTLVATPDDVRLTVEDDGVGFVTGEVTPGLGLEGMRYRAKRIGGVLTVHSTPDAGTRVVLTWPRPRASA